jgi:raffinose/stachyose/melibiose transport system substrate-binding protein
VSRIVGKRLPAVCAWLALLLAAAACAGTPGASPSSSAAPSAAVRTDGFQSLGPVTLTIWSYDNQDPGLEPVLKELSANFSKRYPNVKIDLLFKSSADLLNVIPRTLASDDGPDLTEGNQGYQTDAQLVKAGLILPLDGYVKAYGWDSWYSPATWSIFRWTNDGKSFGQGPVWGVAQTGQNVNIYVNTKKLSALGFDPNAMPTTFDEFNQMLADIRAKLPKDEPVIEEGNQEGYGFIHMFGGIQAAYVAPQDVRDWIMHAPGSTWNTPENVKALETLQSWGTKGYLNSDYDAIKNDASAEEFAKGHGVFWIGGNWDSAIIEQGLGNDVKVMAFPPGPSGVTAGIGATSGPWHISAKAEHPDVAAAWLNYVISSPEAQRLMYGQQQIPAIASATPPPDQPYLRQVTDAWQAVEKDDGLMLYTDWASPTMYQTLASNFQKLMAGQTSAKDMAAAVQADWSKFDATLK